MELVLQVLTGAVVMWSIKFIAGFVYGLYKFVQYKHTGDENHLKADPWMFKL